MAVISLKNYSPPTIEEIEIGDNVVRIEGYITPNQELDQRKAELEAQMLASLPPDDPNEIPELPVAGQPDSGQKTTRQKMLEEIKLRFAPIVDPVMEVMNAANAGVYGTAYDLAVAPYEIITGNSVDRPAEVRNQTYMTNPEDAAILDKGVFYASMGIGLNSAARLAVGNLGKNMARTRSGFDPITGKPFSQTGGESARAGITRDIASTSMSGEVAIGLGMAAAGQLGEGLDVDFLGYDPLTLPLEVAGGLVAALRPSTYLDAATGLTRDVMKSYRDIPIDTDLVSKLLTPQESKLLQQFQNQFGEQGVKEASTRARAAAVSPMEARLALEQAKDPVLSVAQKVDDQGILTLQRAIAGEDVIFATDVREGIDLAQASLAKEFNDLVNPETGQVSFDAFKALLPRIQDDLLRQVDDRVAIAQDRLATINRIYESSPVAASKEFNKVFDEMLADITKQEQNLWQPINDQVLVPTLSLRKEVLEIVNKATKQTNLPKEMIEEIIGRKIKRTDRGWRLVGSVKAGDPVPRPSVKLLANEAPIVLTQLRSKLSTMSRNANNAAEPALQFDQGVLIELQQAVLNNLTRGGDGVSPALKETYETAIAFTKKKHEALTRSSLIPSVRKTPPEKQLGKLLGKQTKDQEDIALAAQELENVFNVTTQNTTSKSQALASAEQYLMNKFAKEVDTKDLASYDMFLANHRDWIKKFPNIGDDIKGARAKAKAQGVVVEDAVLASEVARMNEFAEIAGKNADAMMDIILKAENPTETAARFYKLLQNGSPDALTYFSDMIAKKVAAQSFKNIDAQIAGAGRLETIAPESFRDAMKALGPLPVVFKTDKLKGLELLVAKQNAIARNIQAMTKSGRDPVIKPNAFLELVTKFGALQALSAVVGSNSIVLAGAASRGASTGLRRMTTTNADQVLKEAYRNPELMKILLSDNITQQHLIELGKVNKFRTGRVILNAITEKTIELYDASE